MATPGKSAISRRNYFIILIIIAIGTFGIVYFIRNEDLLEDLWLWFIGLVGPVIAIINRILNYFSSLTAKKDKVQKRIIDNAIKKTITKHKKELNNLQNQVNKLEEKLKDRSSNP